MSNYIINDSELIAIADAIRSKNGTTDEYTTAEMPGAIEAIVSGGGDPSIESLEVTSNGTYAAPEGVDGYSPIVVNVPQDGAPSAEDLVLTNSCQYRFANNGWNWVINKYGNQITSKNISNVSNMFAYSHGLISIPFDINTAGTSTMVSDNMFYNCMNLKEITGDLVNFYPSAVNQIFGSCYHLRYLPNFVNWNWSYLHANAFASMISMFSNCYSLRSIPEEVLNNMWGMHTSSYYSPYNQTFNSCYALDEIKGLGVQQSTLTSNFFNNTFYHCERLKELTFAMNEDGTPKTAKWKSQTIDLSQYVGRTSDTAHILNYNSGITEDKHINPTGDNYAALKDDPDSFGGSKYARYNKASAINTINSLPDTSAYLATAGGTNTIKFTGQQGFGTDEGKIEDLTAEEIAVATAKGWTVSFV